MISTTVDLLRHGQCVGGEIVRGAIDVELTDEGWQQMRMSVESSSANWQRIVSSPLKRCRLFASTIANERQLPLTIIDDLREISFGAWEGRKWSDIALEEPEKMRDFWALESGVSPAGGESLASFNHRCKSGLNEVLDSHNGENILCVTHGGTIRMLLADTLGTVHASDPWDVPYACYSRLSYSQGDEQRRFGRVVFHNRLSTI